MSPCPVLTEEMLGRLLERRLDAGERQALREHFSAPCEACLDLLAGVDGERILAALAGPQADLSASEADRIFAEVLPAPRPASRSLGTALRELFAALVRPPALWPAAAVALALVLLAPSLWWMHGRSAGAGPADYDGIKAAGPAAPLEARLTGFVGAIRDGKPAVLRRFSSGEALSEGEVLLLRFELSAPAYAHLEIAGSLRTEGVWADGAEGSGPRRLMAAGEHELANGGQALAIVPEAFGVPLTVRLIASPKPFAEGAAIDPSVCAGCAVSELHVKSAAAGERP